MPQITQCQDCLTKFNPMTARRCPICFEPKHYTKAQRKERWRKYQEKLKLKAHKKEMINEIKKAIPKGGGDPAPAGNPYFRWGRHN